MKMKRLRIKILAAVTIGAFTTFTILLYVTTERARCNSLSGVLCFYVNRDESMTPKNGTHHVEETQYFQAPVKAVTESFKRYRYVSKSKVINVIFSQGTTADSNHSKFLKSRLSDSFRTPRNFYFSAQIPKVNLLTSTFWRNKTSSLIPNGNRIPELRTTLKYFAENQSEKSVDLNRKDSGDKYLRETSHLMSLLGSKNISSSNNDSYKYYIERHSTLRLGCQKYFNSSHILHVKRLKLDHILIDENKKILFCYVPKVACTNWKRIFMLLTGKAQNMSSVIRLPSYKVHQKNLFTSLQNYTQSEVNQILRDYTKFIFVRNPFERLLSAYRNKLEQHYDSSKYFQARFGKYIIKKFRKNPTNNSLSKGDDVTFSEFVDYLVSSDSSSYNEHWQTVTNLCHPCFINYDLIGKYETLIRDSNFVLNYLNLNVSFPVLEKPSRTAASLKTYFKAISKDVIYKLYSIYEMDFKLFDYDLFKTLEWSNVMS